MRLPSMQLPSKDDLNSYTDCFFTFLIRVPPRPTAADSRAVRFVAECFLVQVSHKNLRHFKDVFRRSPFKPPGEAGRGTHPAPAPVQVLSGGGQEGRERARPGGRVLKAGTMVAGTINSRRGDWNREGRQKRAARKRQFQANTAPLFKTKKVTAKRAKYVERKKRKLLQEAAEAGLLGDDSHGDGDAMVSEDEEEANLVSSKPKLMGPVSLAGPSKKGEKKTARRKAKVAAANAAAARAATLGQGAGKGKGVGQGKVSVGGERGRSTVARRRDAMED